MLYSFEIMKVIKEAIPSERTAMTRTEQVTATAHSHKKAHNHIKDSAESFAGLYHESNVLPVITVVVYRCACSMAQDVAMAFVDSYW